jgi:hypothetical protein
VSFRSRSRGRRTLIVFVDQHYLTVSDGLEFRLHAARWQIATSSCGPAKAGTPNTTFSVKALGSVQVYLRDLLFVLRWVGPSPC